MCLVEAPLGEKSSRGKKTCQSFPGAAESCGFEGAEQACGKSLQANMDGSTLPTSWCFLLRLQRNLPGETTHMQTRIQPS